MDTDTHEYKILVIEDNPGDFALVEDFLFEHIEAPQIVNAVTFKQATSSLGQKTFDVILLDLSLPDKKGESLILEILEVCNQTPVIVLTGYTDFSFGVKTLAMGVSDYILKDDLTSMSLYKSVIYSIERKKSVTELEVSEKRYSDLFNLSPLPMWLVDFESLAFLDVNIATVNHYGFSRDEFLSMTLRDIRPAEEIANLERLVEDGRLKLESQRQRLVIHKKKNGEIINVEIQIAPVIFKEKKANVVIANDVTERFKYIKAIEDQNERLKEISWIQSHIVRAPLTKIMGLLPLINNLCDSEEERKQMMDYVVQSANELDEIIKEITDKSNVDDFQNLVKPPDIK